MFVLLKMRRVTGNLNSNTGNERVEVSHYDHEVSYRGINNYTVPLLLSPRDMTELVVTGQM